MDYFDLDFQSLEERFIASSGMKKGKLAVVGCYTPNRQGNSWVEKANQLYMAARLGGKTLLTSLAFSGWAIDDFQAWVPKTKLLQSKSKQSRIVRVVIKK